MGPVSTKPPTMQLVIFVSLAAAAHGAPQIVPYVHEEIAAEPYIHEEIAAEPYVHIEPEISPLALGIVRPKAAAAAPQQFATPAAPQQFAQFAQQPQFAAPAAQQGVWTGTCYNNLGAGVPCRQ